jgi:hypothetical protein
MNASEKLEQIKNWLFTWSKETFTKYTLLDGSVVVVNGELKEGAKVFKQNEDDSMNIKSSSRIYRFNIHSR